MPPSRFPLDDIELDDSEFAVRKHLHRSECPICKSGAFGIKFTRDFHTRPDVHARDLAVHFNMTEEEVMDHINNHELVVSIQQTPSGEDYTKSLVEADETSPLKVNDTDELFVDPPSNILHPTTAYDKPDMLTAHTVDHKYIHYN